MASFISAFLDVMADTVTITPGYNDYTGKWVASGSTFAPNCYIEGEERLVRNGEGLETLSTLQIYLDGSYGLDVKTHRFTLPARYTPKTNLEPISIVRMNDETGAAFEIVMLP